MNNIEGGYILNSNDVVEKNKVKFQINIETHLIIIDFIDEVTIIDDNNPINHLFLLDSNGNKLTILDFHIEKRSNRKVEILFSTIILGKHEEKPDELKPSKVYFGIGSNPIPLLDIHLPKKAVKLDNFTFEFQNCKDSSYLCDLIISPTKESLLLTDLETVFFNIMDILFLCFGFYPYIDNESRSSVALLPSQRYRVPPEFCRKIKHLTGRNTCEVFLIFLFFLSIVNSDLN